MAIGYVVKERFHKRGASGAVTEFAVGQVISDPAVVASIQGTEHENHCIRSNVPDHVEPPAADEEAE